jgi:hypothetical protein
MSIGHLGAMAILALLLSLAFASIGHQTIMERVRHAAWCFFLFLAFAVGVAWLLFPLSR